MTESGSVVEDLSGRRQATDDLQGIPARATPLPPSTRSPWRFVSAFFGWVVGLLTLLLAAVAGLTAFAYWPDAILAGACAIAGALVLPPVTHLTRLSLPPMRPTVMPPLVFVVLCALGGAGAQFIAPTGLARDAMIVVAMREASAKLAAGNPDAARGRVSYFTDDAKSHPALAALLAQIAAAEARKEAAAAPAPPGRVHAEVRLPPPAQPEPDDGPRKNIALYFIHCHRPPNVKGHVLTASLAIRACRS